MSADEHYVGPSLPDGHFIDGGIMVNQTIAAVLFALATDMEHAISQVTDNVASGRGDFISDIANLDDYAAQLRVLASGSWGAS